MEKEAKGEGDDDDDDAEDEDEEVAGGGEAAASGAVRRGGDDLADDFETAPAIALQELKQDGSVVLHNVGTEKWSAFVLEGGGPVACDGRCFRGLRVSPRDT